MKVLKTILENTGKKYKFLFVITVLILLSVFACKKTSYPLRGTGADKMPKEWTDSITGHHLVRLTDTSGEYRSFYFHNNPFFQEKDNEGDLMVFYGSKHLSNDKVYKGKEIKQIFTINLKTREITQITNHPAPIHGEIVSKKRREVIYQSNDTVFATNIDNKITHVVYIFPDSIKRGGITTINADENLLAGTYSDTRKMDILKNNPKKSDYFSLIFEAKIPHTLFTINIETRKMNILFSDTAWINHVQFSPTDPDMLMFCHEGHWHKVDRIWLINIFEKVPRLMHKRTVYREIAGHEFFSYDGTKIWFDLQIPRGETFYLANADVKTGEEHKYSLTRDEWSIHYNISPDQQWFAGDGGDSGQVAHAKDGKWLYLFKPEGDHLVSEKLVDMSKHDYDLEPNVHFTPDGKWIIFRANFEGKSQIYEVEIKK